MPLGLVLVLDFIGRINFYDISVALSISLSLSGSTCICQFGLALTATPASQIVYQKLGALVVVGLHEFCIGEAENEGHVAPPKPNLSLIVCSNCNKTGHFANKCLFRPQNISSES